MFIELLKAKIHRVRVTEANLNYVGSITIDTVLMEAAGILSNEKVLVVNINTGDRFETYAIRGERSSGIICLNGAAARLVQPDDMVIIMCFAWFKPEEAEHHKPKVIFCDVQNRMISG